MLVVISLLWPSFPQLPFSAHNWGPRGAALLCSLLISNSEPCSLLKPTHSQTPRPSMKLLCRPSPVLDNVPCRPQERCDQFSDAPKETLILIADMPNTKGKRERVQRLPLSSPHSPSSPPLGERALHDPKKISAAATATVKAGTGPREKILQSQFPPPGSRRRRLHASAP